MSEFWSIQKEVWWQLSWRAPNIKSGTLLFVNLPIPFGFASGEEAWAPANLIYYPIEGPPRIVGEVLDEASSYMIFQGVRAPKQHRSTIWLNRNFGNPLVLSMPTQESCLNVIDGQKMELSSAEEPMVRLAAPYSRIDRIISDAAFTTPPKGIFGSEPDHTWCYYYQKAQYYRQIGAWDEVARLGDEAAKNHYRPQDSMEWIPFFEAYVNLDRDKDAKDLAEIIKKETGPLNVVCRQMELNPPTYSGKYDKIREYLCSN